MTKDDVLIGGFIISAFGLLLNAYATFKNISSRKLSNYQEIVKSHRDIWKITIDKSNSSEYSRILKKTVNINSAPITDQEKRFVQFLIFHMTSAYYFSKHSDMIQIEKLRYDFCEFISLPIPNKIWSDTKKFYNKDFVIFIDFDPDKLHYFDDC